MPFTQLVKVRRGKLVLAIRRRGDEPFFTLGLTIHDWGWLKNGPFWTKKGQTWQACQHSKVVQKGLKGTKIVNLSVFDH